jgi:hypothetical protein
VPAQTVDFSTVSCFTIANFFLKGEFMPDTEKRKRPNRVFVFAEGERIAFKIKGSKKQTLFITRENGELIISSQGGAVSAVHDTLQQKVTPVDPNADRVTYKRVIEVEADESVELTVERYYRRNHVYAVARNGTFSLCNGSALVRRITLAA